MGKITLKEFWDKADKGINAVIHCDTEEKAEKLLAEFDKMGKCWASGDSYKTTTNWWSYTVETCYSNQGQFTPKNYYEDEGYTIYEFEDVIFDERKTISGLTNYPKIARITMSNGKDYYYALYDTNIKRKSYVVVTGKAEGKLLKVAAVYDAENRPDDCPEYLTQEVIGEINMKPYNTRLKERRKKKREEINMLAGKVNKLREKLLQDFLNQNDEYKALTTRMKELQNR